MPVHTSNATWNGNLADGKGAMIVGESRYEGPYTFASRFKDGEGTNPEELIAAAHAGCFSMALSNILDKAGYTPNQVSTTANVTLDPDQGAITGIELVTEADVPNIDDGTFQKQAQKAKENCPVSKLLTGAEITLKATLVS